MVSCLYKRPVPLHSDMPARSVPASFVIRAAKLLHFLRKNLGEAQKVGAEGVFIVI